jgi:micrococcal nuclease|tara:strand:- start:677 stop:1027 length:351 start_codon:yes stop_codon:yes gene_type:complete
LLKRNYVYTALILSVYDGDTFTAEVDLGFDVKMKMKLRLAEIDTPELRGEEREQGLLVRDYVRDLVLGKIITLESILDKTGKYGRYLAKIYVEQEDGTQLYLNDHLVLEGKAEVYK